MWKYYSTWQDTVTNTITSSSTYWDTISDDPPFYGRVYYNPQPKGPIRSKFTNWVYNHSELASVIIGTPVGIIVCLIVYILATR